MSSTSNERRELERDVIALGEALRCPERVERRVLAQLDDQDLEKLRRGLLRDFKEMSF